MAQLEFLRNRIIDQLSYEWPIGTILRRIQEQDDRINILNRGVTVKGYKQHCGLLCDYCCSMGRVMQGRIGGGTTTTLFCIGLNKIGLNKRDSVVEYWEEDL